MISSALFARYSRALVDVALDTGADAAVSNDMLTYLEIFRAVPDAMMVLHSPGVSKAAKEEFLASLMAQYPVNRVTANFLKILLDRNRFGYFPEICDHYVRTLDERKGIVSAVVKVAGALTGQQAGEIRARIAGAVGRQVKLEMLSDPNLIGGLVLQIGSTVYDGSVRRQLSEIRTRLSAG